MQPERLPLTKVFDVPFLSLDGTSVEMASILFLFLAVILIASVERRRQLIRRVVQAVSLVVFFFVVYSCLGVFGMIRNALYGLTLVGSVYTESFYWMALPVVVIAATLVTGPMFCGWICPTGTLQEIVGWLRRKLVKRPEQPRPTRRQVVLLGLFLAAFLALVIWVSLRKQMFIEDSSLHWAAGLILIVFLVYAGVIEDVPTRRLRLLSISAIFVTAVSHLVVTSPVHFAFTSRSDPASALATGVIMVASLFVLRAWCRYLCPWGYLMGFLARFSRLKIVRGAGECHDCQTCAAACDVGAVERGVVRHEDCQFCFACVDQCPHGTLTVVDTWVGRARADGRAGAPRPDSVRAGEAR
ncbi:MAG: 4Fe-4S binding protein [Deltaproteobacteria bacterium]|nr:4Fe-4S binding protein [Deltaproteobacteria bacterium]